MDPAFLLVEGGILPQRCTSNAGTSDWRGVCPPPRDTLAAVSDSPSEEERGCKQYILVVIPNGMFPRDGRIVLGRSRDDLRRDGSNGGGRRRT